MDAYHKGIQYALKKLGKPNFCFERTKYQILKARHEGSGNEIEEKVERSVCQEERVP